ncbi:MAG: pyridoxal phosphate-dependent aminotransferase [Mogibacterium sp.]|nr:pyridoxal phosphate-dependent aminotransferase [Mogibacterium sp.]
MLNKNFYKLGTAPSPIRALFMYGVEKAKTVGAENIFDYSLGNPSIPAPPKVNETIEDLAHNMDALKLHGYSVAAGHESVRQAIADNLNRRFNAGATSGRIFMTAGCAPALLATAKALTETPEEEFIAIAPFFPEYRVFFQSGGAKLKFVPPDTENFQINLEELEKAITPTTLAVIINSPNNPSGVVYTRETLQKVAAILKNKSEEFGHPIYIVADEPYRELVYGGVEVPFIPEIYNNTIVCYSWSKSLSLPGERIGYVYVPENCENGDALYSTIVGSARELGSVCPPSLMQRVIEACVNEEPDLAAYDENRMLLYEELTAMGYSMAKPDGAFYMLVKAPNGDAKAFSEKAKIEHNLLVVPADGFGCPGYMRLSYCVSNEMIRRSLPAFKAMIESYK